MSLSKTKNTALLFQKCMKYYLYQRMLVLKSIDVVEITFVGSEKKAKRLKFWSLLVGKLKSS